MSKPARVLFFLCSLQLTLVGTAYSQVELREQDIAFGKSWLEQVQVNNSDDDLFVAAVVAQAQEPSLAGQFFTKALDVLEHDSLLMSAAVYHCFSGGVSEFCKGDAIFEEAIRLDPDNLEPYLYYAVRLIENGDENRALSVLNQGMETTTHNDYMWDKEEVITQKLTSVGYPVEEDVRYAAGIYTGVGAYYAFYSKLLSDCPKLSVATDDWKLSCLFLGARMGNSSKLFMANVFGGSIQRDVLIATDADPDVIALIAERREWDNKIRDLLATKVDWVAKPYSEQPPEFLKEQREIPEREALLRAIYRTQ
ncbi:MAG: hypothetical protein V4628_09315 [Pseudomonadota bacterium]